MGEFKHEYVVGKRVGLLARLTDVHDKGAFVMQIEGTDVYLQLPEALLASGADIIRVKVKEKFDLDQRFASGGVPVVEEPKAETAPEPAAGTQDTAPAYPGSLHVRPDSVVQANPATDA